MKLSKPYFLPVAWILAVIFFPACNRGQLQTPKRYSFTGRVVTIDARDQSAVIDGDNIPGFMEAMAMSYKFKPAAALSQLAPGDAISADLVAVEPGDGTGSASWLENVKVTGHVSTPPSTPGSALHMPATGEEVPDFVFTNQDGKRVSLSQYRGKVLLVTFIYTRCPFPDFCPRMSGNFAEIYKQLARNAALANTHLLSLSFDPEHDTPKVLRDYGLTAAHTRDSALFTRWEFATPSSADLPKIANFFALTVKPEGGLITHNLSTAVIAPDGKIRRFYQGSDWQVSDLMKDATAVSAH